jgi:hypothetical protein
VNGNGMPCLEAWLSYERNAMERNAGKNERSGVMDTVAARTQAVGEARSVTNCVAQRSTRRAVLLQQFHKSATMENCCCCTGLAHLLADKAGVRPYYRAHATKR